MHTRSSLSSLTIVFGLLGGLVASPVSAASPSPAPAVSTSPQAKASPASAVLRIAVLDFKTHNTEDADLGHLITEKLEIAFTKNGHYQVIERSEIDKVIKEVAYSQTGLVDTSSAVKVGKQLQARFVVAGSVTRQGPMSSINARLVNVETGAVASADNVDFPEFPPLRDKAIEDLVEKLRTGMAK